MSLGPVLLAVSAVISKFGVGLFTFNAVSTGASFNNMMHFTVNSIVYVFYHCFHVLNCNRLSFFYLKDRFIAMEGDEVPEKSEDWV